MISHILVEANVTAWANQFEDGWKMSQVLNSKSHHYLKLSVGHEWDFSGSLKTTWVMALTILSSTFQLTPHWEKK